MSESASGALSEWQLLICPTSSLNIQIPLFLSKEITVFVCLVAGYLETATQTHTHAELCYLASFTFLLVVSAQVNLRSV